MNFDTEIERALTKIKAIEESQDPHIDGRALGTAAKLIFYAGVGKKEITELKIGEVLSGNEIMGEINLKGTKISLPEGMKPVLKNYIDDIRTKHGSISEDSHLFPNYSGSSGEKKLSKQLEKFNTSSNDLHEAGIKNHYSMLTRSGANYQKNLVETAVQFRMDPRSVKNRLKGITNPAGHKPLGQQSFVERIMYYVGEVQKLTDYEILIEDKVQKLLTDFYNLVDREQELSKDATWLKDFFVKHTIYWVDFNRVISKKIGVVNIKKIPRGLPKDEEVDALKNTLLVYIEKIKGTLSRQEKLTLVNWKRWYDAIIEKNRKRNLGKKEKSEYVSFPKPSMEELKEQLKRYLSEARREENRQRRGGVIKVSLKKIRKKSREIERMMNLYSPRRFGVIEKLDAGTGTIVVTIRKSGEHETSMTNNETRITEGKKKLSFAQLKKGMNVSIVGGQILTAINVYKPTNARKRKK